MGLRRSNYYIRATQLITGYINWKGVLNKVCYRGVTYNYCTYSYIQVFPLLSIIFEVQITHPSDEPNFESAPLPTELPVHEE
jgi:hypothetical protein